METAYNITFMKANRECKFTTAMTVLINALIQIYLKIFLMKENITESHDLSIIYYSLRKNKQKNIRTLVSLK